MKQIILLSSAFMVLVACNSQGEKRTKTVKSEPAKKEDLIVEKKALTKNIVPDKPTEEPKSIPLQERTIKFIPPVVTDDGPPMQEESYSKVAVCEIDNNGEQVRHGKDMAEPPPPPSSPPSPEIYDVVDETAQFPGGKSAMNKYIADNLQYPETAKEAGIEGKAYLKFIVSKQGRISNIMIVKKVSDCPECDMAAVRLVKGMPNFIPGKNGGKAVDSYYILPVVFKIQ